MRIPRRRSHVRSCGCRHSEKALKAAGRTSQGEDTHPPHVLSSPLSASPSSSATPPGWASRAATSLPPLLLALPWAACCAWALSPRRPLFVGARQWRCAASHWESPRGELRPAHHAERCACPRPSNREPPSLRRPGAIVLVAASPAAGVHTLPVPHRRIPPRSVLSPTRQIALHRALNRCGRAPASAATPAFRPRSTCRLVPNSKQAVNTTNSPTSHPAGKLDAE
jgi:hypothetical protein